MTADKDEAYKSWKYVEEAVRLMGVTSLILAKAGEDNLSDRLGDAKNIACRVCWRLETRYYDEMKKRLEEEKE